MSAPLIPHLAKPQAHLTPPSLGDSSLRSSALASVPSLPAKSEVRRSQRDAGLEAKGCCKKDGEPAAPGKEANQ